jgi:DNA replication and repair protein RecF
MYLRELSIVNYKNIEQVTVEFVDGINCFCGYNGMGKTNILDVIYYLSMCKSFFNSIDSQNIKHNMEFFVLQGEYFTGDKQENIYCGFKRGRGKQFKRNKKEYDKLMDHIGLLPVVMISPSDSMLITEGSEERRKYMNGVISQYDNAYLEDTIRYQKILKQRNSFLKQSYSSGLFDGDMLEVMDEQMTVIGERVFNKRIEFLNKLLPVFDRYYREISGADEEVGLQYKSQLFNGPFSELLMAARHKDSALQHTSVGIHRDDLELTINGYPLKRSGSQGQQKSFLMALKLAQFEFLFESSGKKPILLLDDIFDKLDQRRVASVLNIVSDSSFGQIFVTDTNRDRVESLIGTIDKKDTIIFDIENGAII